MAVNCGCISLVKDSIHFTGNCSPRAVPPAFIPVDALSVQFAAFLPDLVIKFFPVYPRGAQEGVGIQHLCRSLQPVFELLYAGFEVLDILRAGLLVCKRCDSHKIAGLGLGLCRSLDLLHSTGHIRSNVARVVRTLR